MFFDYQCRHILEDCKSWETWVKMCRNEDKQSKGDEEEEDERKSDQFDQNSTKSANKVDYRVI